TGKRPFDGDIAEVLKQVVDIDPRAPRSLNKEVPRDLEAICQKAMTKEANSRYSSCSQFRDDLSRWLSGDTILARSTTMFERALRWCRRRPAVAGLACAVIASLVLGTVISSVLAVAAARQ